MSQVNNDVHWIIADSIARELVSKGTDPNELAKVSTYLSQNRDAADFYTLLDRLVNRGKQLARSRQTARYYADIRQACQRLRTIQAPDEMAQTLAWAVRLMRYYPRATQGAEAETGGPERLRRERPASVPRPTSTGIPLAQLQVGEVREGTVKNVRPDLGAFVDIGAEKDGLIHRSELCGQTLQAGDGVTVRVVKVDMERKRIALALGAGAIQHTEPPAEPPKSAMAEALARAQEAKRAGGPSVPSLLAGEEVRGRVVRIGMPWILVELEGGGAAELHSAEGAGLSEGQDLRVWVKSAEPGKRPQVTTKMSEAASKPPGQPGK